MNLEAIPSTLRDRDQWVAWRYEERDGNRTKVPVNAATGQRAKSNVEETWTDFETAVEYSESESRAKGLGFIFSEEDQFVGIDLDNVRDPDSGTIEPWAEDLINRLDSYTEFSPSETGMHVIVLGIKPGDSCKTGMESTLDTFDGSDIEMYDSGRYFTVTGDHMEGTPDAVQERNDTLQEVYEETLGTIDSENTSEPSPELDLSDEELIKKAKNADNGDKFSRLWEGDYSEYPSQSEADSALCQILAFWTGKDQNQMDRLFRQSDLMREKWDEPHYSDGSTYGEGTIKDAIEKCDEVYTPPSSDTDEMAKKYGSITEAISEEPGEWIDAGDQVITVYGLPNADLSAEDAKERLEANEEILDDLLSALIGTEYANAINDYATNPDDWEIETARPADDWSRVRWMYDNSDIPKRDGRHEAFTVLRDRYSFATIRENDELLVYNDGVFEEYGETVVAEVLEQHLERHYTDREKRNITDRLRAATYRDQDEFGADEDDPKICLKNGVLDLATRTLKPHSPEHLFLTRIPVEYDPTAECPEFESFLHDILNDETGRQLVYEMLGYTLWPGYGIAEKFLILYGDGANGKSTLLNVFKEFLGDATSSWNLQSLEENRFATADLYHSLANIGSDLPSTKLSRTGTLKKLTGGDPVQAEKKRKDSFQFENRAKLIFAANNPPVIKDNSHALYRRLLLLHLPNRFTKKDDGNPDAEPTHELLSRMTTTEEMSGILNKALDGLDQVRETGFSQDLSRDELRAKYHRVSDPVARFAQDCLIDDTVEKLVKDDVHQAYNQWAKDNNAPTKSANVFHKALRQNTDVEIRQSRMTISDSRVRVYENLDYTDEGREYSPSGETADEERRRRAEKRIDE